MMDTAALRSGIADRTVSIGVVGLGYVGLPVAALLADRGFSVIGVDLRVDRVTAINAGLCPIEGREPELPQLLERVVSTGRLVATTRHADLAAAAVVLISVETPVDPLDHRPRYAALITACEGIAAHLEEGTLVIVESTVSPQTMANVVVPALERGSGRPHGGGFRLGHCPERVMPGRLLRNLRAMSRVVGGDSVETAEAMIELYRSYVEGDLDPTDLLTAELVKTAENAYRDVNIAFANQLALICEAAGADVWIVRELVNKSPGRNVLLPGAGVGGHCIPKDPWLLASALGDIDAPLISAARALNESMPRHVAVLTAQLLDEAGVELGSARVAVLGYAYLEDSDDTRHSPSAELVGELEKLGCAVSVHDPFIEAYASPVEEAVRGADVAVMMVAHSAYRSLSLPELRDRLARPLIVDARHVFSPAALEEAGFRSRTIGVGGGIAASPVGR
jgi:UDP-N-acetyl-D-mannosaminuronic acid dehydrogenase